jgi:hypothetical protein
MARPEDVLREIEKQASRRWLPIIGREKAGIITRAISLLFALKDTVMRPNR